MVGGHPALLPILRSSGAKWLGGTLVATDITLLRSSGFVGGHPRCYKEYAPTELVPLEIWKLERESEASAWNMELGSLNI